MAKEAQVVAVIAAILRAGQMANPKTIAMDPDEAISRARHLVERAYAAEARHGPTSLGSGYRVQRRERL